MSSILGLGIDVCGIERMRSLVGCHAFLNRYFTDEEKDYIHSKGGSGAQSLAGLFAAKEATLKALGVGLMVPFKDIHIDHTQLGQPVCFLAGEAANAAQGGSILLSITHEEGIAAAIAIWISEAQA